VDLKVMKCKTKGCTNEFIQYNSLTNICVTCAIEKSKKIVAKKYNTEEKERKKRYQENTKTYTQKVNEVKKVFQAWVRKRDENLPCISCESTFSNPFWHGGHYKKAEIYRGLIFNELNVNKQCAKCNIFLNGNESNYRQGLVNRYGIEKVEYLEQLANETKSKKYSDDELNEIKQKYTL
jgi:hypothetical protein